MGQEKLLEYGRPIAPSRPESLPRLIPLPQQALPDSIGVNF